MFTEKDFCSFGTSSFLKDAGYVDPTRYSYIKNTRVSDEIMEKHPGLSDDGYMDLIKEYGGTYDIKHTLRLKKYTIKILFSMLIRGLYVLLLHIKML